MKHLSTIPLLCSSMLAFAGPSDKPEEVLQQLASAYVSGDIGEFAGCFGSEADHNGDNIEDAFFSYFNLFRDTIDRDLRMHDVVVADSKVTAWVTVKAKETCGGPLDIEFNSRGYIQSMQFECFLDETALKGGFDGALSGQAADIATTAVGMAAGLSEANPIVAGMGLPVASILKFGIGEYAETLPVEDCHAVKDGMSLAGWGAAGWNACMIAAAGSGGSALIPCAMMGVAAGFAAKETTSLSNFMICRSEMDGEKFALIDSTGIYRERPK